MNKKIIWFNSEYAVAMNLAMIWSNTDFIYWIGWERDDPHDLSAPKYSNNVLVFSNDNSINNQFKFISQISPLL